MIIKIKKINKYAVLIILSLLLFLLSILLLIKQPKMIITNTNIQLIEIQDRTEYFLTAVINENQKQEINNKLVTIKFMANNAYQKVLANDWLSENEFVIRENIVPDFYRKQQILISYDYQSLLIYFFNNIL